MAPLARPYLIAFAVTALSVAAAAGRSADNGRTFHRLSIAKIANSAPGASLPTHAEITGVVTFARMETDGDRHLRVCEPGAKGACVVVECIPELPAVLAECQRVRAGETVTVRGITRYDGGHHWQEIHPALVIAHGEGR